MSAKCQPLRSHRGPSVVLHQLATSDANRKRAYNCENRGASSESKSHNENVPFFGEGANNSTQSSPDERIAQVSYFETESPGREEHLDVIFGFLRSIGSPSPSLSDLWDDVPRWTFQSVAILQFTLPYNRFGTMVRRRLLCPKQST